jgi:hypothetical protein
MREHTLSLLQARQAAADVEGIAEEIGVPATQWASRCHEISVAILRTGRFGPGRVARGTATGITGQHSWIVLGDDCYDPQAIIVDPTLMSTVGPAGRQAVIIVDRARKLSNRPHGAGTIWAWGQPTSGGGEPVALATAEAAKLSSAAHMFLSILGPLDYEGWAMLAHAPVEGWPAAEIIAAMYRTTGLKSLIPIDIVGMLTDINPGGLYR